MRRSSLLAPCLLGVGMLGLCGMSFSDPAVAVSAQPASPTMPAPQVPAATTTPVQTTAPLPSSTPSPSVPTTTPASTNTPVPVAPTNASLVATLALTEGGERIYANILIKQAANTPGHVTIVWTPPKGTACPVSSYVLTYAGTQYHTRAYRTIVYANNATHQLKRCTGMWQARVVDEANTVLADKTIMIDELPTAATPAPAATAPLATPAPQPTTAPAQVLPHSTVTTPPTPVQQ